MTQTTSDEHRDALLAKVRKLLAKAEDPAATTEEAETYTAKATALIASWGIDAALLAADDPARDPVGDRVVAVEAPYAADKADLLAVVALRLRCQVVVRTRRRSGGTERSVHLFGHRSDLERSVLLFTSLLVQSHHALARTPVPPWEHAAAFRRSWLAGFTGAVAGRLEAAERRAEADADAGAAHARGGSGSAGRSTAVVLADRASVVREAAAAAYPQARTARPRQLSGGGAADGWAAGQRADLGGTRLAGRRGLPPGG